MINISIYHLHASSIVMRFFNVNGGDDNNRILKNAKTFKRISKPKKNTSLELGDILLSPPSWQ